MKILHASASYLPATRYGGTIVSVHGLCRALAARGHDVHVCTTSVDGPHDSPVPHGVPVDLDGVKVWYFRSPRGRRLYYAPEMSAMLRRHIHEFDVAHTHAIYLWPLWQTARAARRAAVPYVVSPRGMLEKELLEKKSLLWKAALIGFIERPLLEHAAAIHVTSAREADEARRFGFNLPAIAEIPNGVDEARGGGSVSTDIAALIEHRRYALFLGRINWKKGLDRLIRALPHAPELDLVIAGNDEEGYRPTLDAIAAGLGVAHRVHYAGTVGGGDKAALLSHAEMLILPSYSENFGNVVLEALAAGTPAIVTPEVGVSAMVRAEHVGLVIEGSPERLGGAIARLAANPAEREAMGERGRRVARERYSWSAVAERMERLYESITC